MSQLNVTSLKHEGASGDNITLSSNGNVGIGTSLPLGDLTVTRSDAAELVLQATGAGGNAWFVQTGNTGSTINGALRFYDYNAGAERMRIDSAGRVTKPYQPMFSASRYLSNGNVSSNLTRFLWGTIFINQGSNFNNTTGDFTCPVAGNYFVTFNFNKRASYNNWIGAAILRNGDLVSSSWVPPSTLNDFAYCPLTLNVILACAASDTISFAYFNAYSTPSIDNDGNFCSVQLIG